MKNGIEKFEEQKSKEYKLHQNNTKRVIDNPSPLDEAEALLEEDRQHAIQEQALVFELEMKMLEQEYKNNPTQELMNKIHKLEEMIFDLVNNFNNSNGNSAIENKKLITVKEFEKLYSISIEQQRILRGRHNDPLPYIQINERGNVLYDPQKVEKWLENYHK